MKKNDPAKAQQYFEDKVTFTAGPVELSRLIKENADINVVDVRAAKDYQAGHIPTAVNLPQEQWHLLEGLREDKLNVLYCYTQTCHLAARAAIEFAGKGFEVKEMEGGFKGWQESHLPVESMSEAKSFS